MSSLFTKIINGELPGRFVWSDPESVAFLTIEPIRPGHTLVVPRAEVDQWLDLPTELAQHLFTVAGVIGTAQRAEFNASRVGLLIEGYGVPHTHLHVWPSESSADFDPANIDREPDPEQLEEASARIRRRLREHGYGELVPTD